LYNLTAFFIPNTDFPTLTRASDSIGALNICKSSSNERAIDTAVSYPTPSYAVIALALRFTSFGRKIGIGARGRSTFLLIRLSSCALENPRIALC